ncbi:MAG: ribonuclease D [Planctomycetes bacterium]|nr:ribonuclease D [Planctomycetota bacterium]
MIIQTETELRALCDHLRAAGAFALDSEFIPEGHYYPRLAILQVATTERAAIIDSATIGTLAPFVEVVADPAVEKYLHDARMDLEILYDRTGRLPRNVLDTQIAAAFVGYGERISYARLVERVTGVRLAKLETRSDWTHRPLSPAQVQYALDDVKHLAAVRAHLLERLAAANRLDWVREECRAFESAEAYERTPPREQFRRVRSSNGLDARALALLRELAAWREEAAMDRDVPREHVLRDDDLVELARRAPTKEGMLRGMRIRNVRELAENGGAIVAAVKAGLACAAADLPVAATPRDEAVDLSPGVSLLEAWLRARCQETGVAAGCVAGRDDLTALVAARVATTPPDLPLLRGWRRTLVGEDLLSLLSGRLKLAMEPGTGRLVAL